ncbi:hypothetical protein [Cohnella thailandensis]|uniref:Uncharacterized protein n=1 Tax=Cohnella thailandensis TaxID=557557 RepID=A0A841T5U5_9BACL|nr:hypothetical protein [Cohnella thailandensis]MBB6637237.1 hypothetical protein [Cohnella thailandensis]MBP1976912.1 hypothetical protein [Cohnella thailandensis]
MNHTSILFQFPQEQAARVAYDTLAELGYDPQLHEGGRLHIHVIREDLTSALEIVQSHGGELVESEDGNSEVESMACVEYGLDSIPIPAHLVNEDWVSIEENGQGELTAWDREQAEVRELDPDPGAYDTFEAR